MGNQVQSLLCDVQKPTGTEPLLGQSVSRWLYMGHQEQSLLGLVDQLHSELKEI